MSCLRFMLVLWTALGTTGVAIALAEDPPSVQEGQPPAPGGQAPSDAIDETVDPQDGRLRPFARRPLTGEEREEAERLKRLAAIFGNDPTAIVGRLQLSSQYADLTGNKRLSDTVARVDLPFRNNWLLRMDMPFLRWSDPGTSSTKGASDLFVTTGLRVYNTPEYGLFVGAVSTFPTAVSNLGSGKYTVGPLLASARFLPRIQSFLFGVLSHQLSVGGDPGRADVQFSRLAAQINTMWADRWWTAVQGVVQVNWERHAKSGMTLEFEVGRNLMEKWGFYARPGVGLWGRDLVGIYEWNIEVGVRRVFASF